MPLNWLREIWNLRPPVSPWWMYDWLEGWGHPPHSLWNTYPWWRKIAHSMSCWWLLWRWTNSPEGYDIMNVRSGDARPPAQRP